MTIEVADLPVRLLASGPVPDVGLGQDALARLAHLTIELAHREARANGASAVLNPEAFRPYEDRSPLEREALSVMVRQVTQALVMLGWIEI